MIANNGTNEEAPEIKLDDMLGMLKQLEDMTLAHLPKGLVETWGREVALKFARSAEGNPIGTTRVFLPRGYEHTGEMFLIHGDKIIHIGASFLHDGTIPVVMGKR